MRRLIYLPTAREDLLAILRHITHERGEVGVGLGFLAKLEARCERIASLPGTLGTSRPDLRSDIRSITEHGYVIFFRYVPGKVEIVNVVGGRRDLTSLFADTDPPQSH